MNTPQPDSPVEPKQCRCACHTHKLASNGGLIHDRACCMGLEGSLEWPAVETLILDAKIKQIEHIIKKCGHYNIVSEADDVVYVIDVLKYELAALRQQRGTNDGNN